ncbi:MAG: DUF1284 domain-containing protein [Ruminococcus sp.]|nr:DUF1284 domain-containing protein [Ruminococcus sp.]
MPICKIRPHHGLCTAFFIGKGYDSAFTANMSECIAMLRSLDPTVELTVGSDIICEKCPNRRGSGCRSMTPEQYDRKVLEILGLPEHMKLKWSEFSEKAKDIIIDGGRLSEVCGECQWSEICIILGATAKYTKNAP